MVTEIVIEESPLVHIEIVGFRFELSENPHKEDKIPEGFKIQPSYDMKR